jgi:hypothetical protein
MTQTPTATCVPAQKADLSATLMGDAVRLDWTRSTDPMFLEYDVFRADPPRVSSESRGLLFLLSALLSAWGAAALRTSRRRAGLLLVSAMLPLSLASADAAGERQCALPGCTLLKTYTNPIQTEHIDADVQQGDSFQYFVRVVNSCGSFADTDMVPVSLPVPTPTPLPTRTATPVPPTATATSAPPTSTPTPLPAPTLTPTPEVIQVEVLGTNWKGAEKSVTMLHAGDAVTLGSASGTVRFNVSPPQACIGSDVNFTVDANGLDRATYEAPSLVACYTGPDDSENCPDALTSSAHAGLYLKRGSTKQFLGRSGASFTASGNEQLSLGVNDCDRTMNDGKFTLNVTVRRAR